MKNRCLLLLGLIALGCHTDRSAPEPQLHAPVTRLIAEPGDVQVVDLPEGYTSAAVEYVDPMEPGLGGPIRSSHTSYFGSSIWKTHKLAAQQAHPGAVGRRFPPGQVRIELHGNDQPGVLYVSRSTIYVDPTAPTVLSISAFDQDASAATRPSLYGFGKISEPH